MTAAPVDQQLVHAGRAASIWGTRQRVSIHARVAGQIHSADWWAVARMSRIGRLNIGSSLISTTRGPCHTTNLAIVEQIGANTQVILSQVLTRQRAIADTSLFIGPEAYRFDDQALAELDLGVSVV